jgi:hypothetical protein
LLGEQGGGEKFWQSYGPLGMQHTQFFRAEGEAAFISMKQRVGASQLLKGKSENL